MFATETRSIQVWYGMYSIFWTCLSRQGEGMHNESHFIVRLFILGWKSLYRHWNFGPFSQTRRVFELLFQETRFRCYRHLSVRYILICNIQCSIGWHELPARLSPVQKGKTQRLGMLESKSPSCVYLVDEPAIMVGSKNILMLELAKKGVL